MWHIKKFNELSTDELYDIIRLRNSIFVVEQKRLYQDLDSVDKRAPHLFKTDSEGEIVAYARIFLEDDGQTVSFGRVATSWKVRGQGIGDQLLDRIMDTIRTYFPQHPIEIEAQEYVQNFYKKAGFKTQGGVFIFSHTPHIKMVHEPLAVK